MDRVKATNDHLSQQSFDVQITDGPIRRAPDPSITHPKRIHPAMLATSISLLNPGGSSLQSCCRGRHFMNETLWAMLTVFGLGIAYFLAAIPTGVAMHLNPWTAALCAWAGYTAIAAAMLAVGTPARKWLTKKFHISARPDPQKFLWRVWIRWGLPGLALIAPVTCGPYFAALIALMLGERPWRLLLWIALGVIPWCIFFVVLAETGSHLFQPRR